MKKIPLLLLMCFLSFAYLGCTGRPNTKTNRIVPVETVESVERPWVIIDYQGGGSYVSIPSWIDTFLDGYDTGVEALEEYQDRFVFVAVNSGNNFTALKQWQDSFSPELDFARLAAVRIEKRFLSSLTTSYPDDEYGAYYETLIRGASDFNWKGAVREDDYWIKRRYTDDGETDEETFQTAPVVTESFDFFVLVTIEKSLMVPQTNELLAGIRPVPPLTKDQNTAVNRVRDHFFEGF